jgi:hypothetical protein
MPMGGGVDGLIRFQDFNFKILHQVGSRHTNVDALRQNPIDVVEEDEDLKDDIQDFKLLQ